jgi:hypothetical protein
MSTSPALASAQSHYPLAAAHGTRLDGVWVKKDAPKPLRQGSMFCLGASSRIYVVAALE